MAQKLIEKGYTKVYALKGGWNEWLASEYPVEEIVRESGEGGAAADEEKETAPNSQK